MHRVDLTSQSSKAADSVDTMGFADDLALAFAAMVTGLATVGEMKDIELCMIATTKAGDRLASTWRCGLHVVSFLRRRVFILNVLNSACILVLFHGSDALSVCMNTVAILFIFEVDNAMFTVGTAERVRTRVETVGRVEIQEAEARKLARTKWIYTGMVTIAVLAGVQLAVPMSKLTDNPVFAGVHLVNSFVLALASVIDELSDPDRNGVLRRVGYAIGLSVLGSVVAMMCSMVAFALA